jgi:threonylcarbamoyladenosine tRNA methylthiotransferase MtaB
MPLEVITFGCRLNAYESELIKQAAEQSAIINDHTIILNSCAVTSEAERQLRQTIRKTRASNPNARIILTGCAAQINPQKYAAMSEIDAIIGNEEKGRVGTYQMLSSNQSDRIIVNDIMSVKETAPQLVEAFAGKARGFLQVQAGCNHRCTFCIIPYGRGNSRSLPVGAIVEQAQKLVDSGYAELVLTGVDITDYGLDLPGKPTLAQMIRRLLNLVPGLKRLRLSSIDVAEIDDELFSLLTNEARIMPHLHLSLQAGDDMILKRMKRRHRRSQVIEFCQRIREARPEITFGADIIAGFPTETEEMFANTCAIIVEANLTFLHVFPYSEREGTPAARMPQVPKQLRKQRAAILRQLGQKKLKEHLQNQHGKVINVVLEQENLARAEDYCQVKIIGLGSDFQPGQVLNVSVSGDDGEKLHAVVIT